MVSMHAATCCAARFVVRDVLIICSAHLCLGAGQGTVPESVRVVHGKKDVDVAHRCGS